MSAAAAYACLSFFPLNAAPPAAPQEEPEERAVAPVKFERVKTSKQTALAVEWLEDHQSADGCWSCSGLMEARPGAGKRWEGGDPNHTVGISSLAALAILRATPGTKRAPVPDSVRLWLAWVEKQQNKKNGRFGEAVGQAFH
ncbi:MAG: hypothetical protein AAGG01_16535 [Planctomycetota bacterium]